MDVLNQPLTDRLRAATFIAIWTGWLSVFTMVAWAQEDWAASPYRVSVRVALEPLPELTDGWRERFGNRLVQVVSANFGAAWNVGIELIPPADVPPLLEHEELAAELLDFDDEETRRLDKLMVLAVVAHGAGYRCRVREFDVGTRLWGPPQTVWVRDPARIGDGLLDAVIQAFRPVGRFVRVRKNLVDLSIRASLLSDLSSVDIVPRPGAVMEAVLRRTDQSGAIAADGIQRVPWTALRVEEVTDSQVTCEVVSGLRSPFRTRTSRRVDRLALLFTPSYQQTVLTVKARDESAQPLFGYQVFARPPGEGESKLIGTTDWQGQVTIPVSEQALQIVYIKNGGLLLARLPIVVGQEPEVEASIPDDRQRLRAEGFIRGIQDELVDTVARREAIALQIQRQIQSEFLTEADLDKADQLLQKLRDLSADVELARELERGRPNYSSPDNATQNRIDRLFRDTAAAIRGTLSNDLAGKLAAQIAEARSQLERIKKMRVEPAAE